MTTNNTRKSSFGRARKLKALAIGLLVVLGIMASVSDTQAGMRFTVASGSWSNTAMWSSTSGGPAGASVPTVGDTVVIEGGQMIQVNNSVAVDSIVLLNDNLAVTTLQVNSSSITVSGGMTLMATKATGRKDIVKLLGSSHLGIGGDFTLLATLKDSRVDMKNTSTLTVNGDVYLLDSAGVMSEIKAFNTTVLTVMGDIHFWATGQGFAELEMSQTSKLRLTGDFVRSGPDFYGELNCANTSIVEFIGTAPQVWDMTKQNALFWRYGEVWINNATGVTLNGDITQADGNNTVKDSICVLSGAILYSGGYSIALANNMIFEIFDNATYYTTTQDGLGGLLDPTGTSYHDIHDNSTVIFAAAGDQNIILPDNVEDYGNVVVMGAGIKEVQDNITIVGDLTIQAGGTLDLHPTGDYTINLGGDWTNNGMFYEQQGKIIFDGVADQNVYGVDDTFYNVEVNKPTGDVILDVSPIITNELNLTSGDIVLDVNDLTMDYTGSIAGAPGANSYVQADGSGEMRKRFNSAPDVFDFPIGDVDDYSPFEITINNASFGGTDYIGMRVVDAKHTNNSFVNHITRYWVMDYMDFTTLDYDFRFVYDVADVVGTEAAMSSIRDASGWITHASVNTGTHEGHSAVGITTLPSVHEFTAGGAAVLPIELANFNASVEGEKVRLDWTTATEINNDFFTLERSTNGIEYEIVGKVDGKGTTYSMNTYTMFDGDPYQGTSYYRLKQTDFDGNYTYTDPVAVTFEGSGVFTLKAFPNPMVAGADLNLEITGIDAGEEMVVVLYNAFGKEVFSKVIVAGNGTVLNGTELSRTLPQGVYYIVGTSNDKVCKEKLVLTGTTASIR